MDIDRQLADVRAMGLVPVGQLQLGGELGLGEYAREPVTGTLLLQVRLDGKPQRSKQTPLVRGKRVTMISEKGWREWRDTMVADLRALVDLGELPVLPITGPVIAGVVAVFPRPLHAKKSYTLDKVVRPYPFVWHEGRVPYIGDPDHDQVTKAGLDVLVRARLLGDDTLVVGYHGGVSRFYAARGEEPHVEVSLWKA